MLYKCVNESLHPGGTATDADNLHRLSRAPCLETVNRSDVFGSIRLRVWIANHAGLSNAMYR